MTTAYHAKYFAYELTKQCAADSVEKIAASLADAQVDRSGVLRLVSLSVAALEREDHLLFAAFADDGSPLDPDQCRRLFSLSVDGAGHDCAIADDAKEGLDQQLEMQQRHVLESLMRRNVTCFDEESEKLDKWADDLKVTLELELKDLDIEIKAVKREARLEPSLETKLRLHRKAKEMEAARSKKRRELFATQDQIDGRKESLISEVEARLKQRVSTEVLFTLRWRLE